MLSFAMSFLSRFAEPIVLSLLAVGDLEGVENVAYAVGEHSAFGAWALA
jgi:hypothetical protein